MLIGDHGKVIELKHIRWLIAVTAFLLLCAIAATVILFVNNTRLSSANDNLRQSLETSRARMKKVQQQTDLLMAQLALAEARANDSDRQKIMHKTENIAGSGNSDEGVKETESKPGIAGSTEPTPAKKTVKTASKSVAKPVPAAKPAIKNKPVSKPDPKPTVKAKAAPQKTAASTNNDVMVEIDGLKLNRPPGSGTVNLEFKVRNVSPKPQRLEGRVLAILKGDTLSPSQWIPIPNVKLVDGRPATVKGHRFAINNWRTMRMRTSYNGPIEQFNLVEIYVYSMDGEIWLRELEPVKHRDQ